MWNRLHVFLTGSLSYSMVLTLIVYFELSVHIQELISTLDLIIKDKSEQKHFLFSLRV